MQSVKRRRRRRSGEMRFQRGKGGRERERERERDREREKERVVWGRGSKVVKCDTFRPCSFGFGGSNPPLFLVLKTILFHY